MISFVTVDEKLDEEALFKAVLKKLAAELTDEKWNIDFYSQLKDFLAYVEGKPLIDMACYDVCPNENVDALLDFRNIYKEMQLMLLADTSVSPTVYLRPGVKPDSLILRPLTNENVEAALSEFVQAYIKKYAKDTNENVFLIEGRDGKIAIPYSDIYYFESKEKKVFVRTLNDEYGYYDSLDSLEDNLPEEFVRCHRSYIVNTKCLKKVYLSQNYLELIDGFDVPLSRTYKTKMKDYK